MATTTGVVLIYGCVWVWADCRGNMWFKCGQLSQSEKLNPCQVYQTTQGHLRYCNTRDATLDSEAKLLSARAGMF